MEYAWIMHRLCTHYVQPMRGLGMDNAWNMHGLCQDHAWTMNGLCMGYTWIMYGSCTPVQHMVGL